MKVSMHLYSDDGFRQKGECITDEKGNFNFLLSDFKGKGDLTLTSSQNDKNKSSIIALNRTFSPTPRALNIFDRIWYPPFIDNNQKKDIQVSFQEAEEEKTNSEEGLDPFSKLLPTVNVVAKKKIERDSEGKEGASLIYDVAEWYDKLCDTEVGGIESIPEFLAYINPYFSHELDSSGLTQCRYKNKKVLFIFDNVSVSRSIFENIDNIIVSSLETITISEVPGLVAKYMSDTDSINFRDIDKYMLIFLYPNKFNMNQSMPKGVRKTKLQGYSEVKEFRSEERSVGKECVS